MSGINKEGKIRIILLSPNQWLLNQFSFESFKRKIVWNRKDDNPSEFALNEWPRIKSLKIILFLPFLFFVIISAVPALLFLVVLHFVNKAKSELFYEKYFEWLNWLAKSDSHNFYSERIKNAKSFTKSPKYKGLLRVLFIENSKSEILLKINRNRLGLFIDEIWMYDEFDEIVSRIVSNNYLLSESFISENNEDLNQCSVKWLIEENSILIAKKEWLKNEQELSNIQEKRKGLQIKLNPNDFLNNDIVFYYESSYNLEVNEYILENYDSINELLNKKSMSLLYVPKLLKDNAFISPEDLYQYTSYLHPGLFSFKYDIQELSTSLFNDFDIASYYKGMALSLNIPEMQYPVFLHSTEIAKGIKSFRNYTYSSYELKLEVTETVKALIDYYLLNVNIAHNNAQYRIVAEDPEDLDHIFSQDEKKLSAELQKTIETIKKSKDEKTVLTSMIYIINSFKDVQPDLCKSINKILYDTIKNKQTTLSRLHIDSQYRIFLTDYNNIEIDLPPLPKTLYLLMLRNPEGIRLKELSNYRNQLIDLYSKVGNRLDINQVKNSIKDLIDPRSNSINEKCSRIKEAFLLKIDNSVAHHYYITGSRSENKRVALDPSLVIFSETK